MEPGTEAKFERAVTSAGLALGFTAVKVRFVERLELGTSGKLQLTGEDERHELEVR